MRRNILTSFLRAAGYVIAIHLLCLLALTLCRIVLLVANMPEEGVNWSLLPTALLIGVKFDNLIACYVSALPAVVVPVYALCTMHRPDYSRWMKNLTCGVVWYYSVLYTLLLMVHVANARYFHFFENHLNIGVTTGLLPNTGIPLPFVSYGLTSLICLYAGLGLVQNVYLRSQLHSTNQRLHN